MNFDLKYYFAVFLRRFHWFALVSAIISAIGVSAALLLSPKYDASATLLVQPPEIELGDPRKPDTGSLEELQLIEERLMTRVNLLDVANRLKVFGAATDANPDDIVEAMRGMTTIDKASGKDAATIMRITFTANRAPITAQVVNEYVTLILQENAQTDQERALSKVKFYERQVENLGAKLDQQEEKILAFKRSNAEALPDSLDFRLAQQASLQERIVVIDRDIAALRDQAKRLIEVYKKTGTVTNVNSDQRSPEQKQLDEVRAELSDALLTFSPTHPTVKKLQARVAQLEEVVSAQAPIIPNAQADGEDNPLLQVQLADIDSRITGMTSQKEQLTAEMATLKETIDKTPANAIALSALERDAANISAQYNQATADAAKAKAVFQITSEGKGQRINLIESATVPEGPTSPNRPVIALAGILGGIFAGLGLVLLLDLMNTSVRRPVDLVKKLGITPIATLPYVRTKGETFGRRAIALAATLAVVLGVPAALYAVHTYYLPLDLLVQQVMSKAGIKL